MSSRNLDRSNWQTAETLPLTTADKENPFSPTSHEFPVSAEVSSMVELALAGVPKLTKYEEAFLKDPDSTISSIKYILELPHIAESEIRKILYVVEKHQITEVLDSVLGLLNKNNLNEKLQLQILETTSQISSESESVEIIEAIAQYLQICCEDIKPLAISILINFGENTKEIIEAVDFNLSLLISSGIDPHKIIKLSLSFSDSQKLIMFQALELIADPITKEPIDRFLTLSSLLSEENTPLHQAAQAALDAVVSS